MPIYEYKCHDCGAKFEVLVYSNSDKAIVCEKCGSENSEKLFSGFATSGAPGSSGSSCGGSGGFS